MSKKLLPGQKEDETEEEYLERIEQRVQERLRAEGNVPDRFQEIGEAPTLRSEHPVFRTTNHDYGTVAMSEYERPTTYRTVTRQFTEKQHLGHNFHHSGFNL